MNSLIITSWLSLCTAGFAILAVYQHTPGPASEVSDTPGVDGKHIDFFLHPDCQCSKASLQELESVLDRVSGLNDYQLNLYLFSAPGISQIDIGKKTAHDWNVQHDEMGQFADHAGVKTSGHVLVYGAGRLLFSGGVTASRGKPGANAYSGKLYQVLTQTVSETVNCPVFGCGLLP